MTVEVRLFASFRNGRFKMKDVETEAGYSVGDVLGKLEIPVAEVGILMVNGESAAFERTLAAGDVLAVFPAVGGG
ncbi:MAG: MoaD/ThiS family protein [Planctomycetes bacterium]|nr:MoaD/ThiS family protein [Planctomycetota bacterium]